MRRHGLAIAIGWLASACGADAGDAGASDPLRTDRGPAWRERLRDAGVRELLAALAQDHRSIRSSVGAHGLETRLELEMVPDRPERFAAPGDPVVLEQAIVDSVRLAYASAPGEPLAFHLEQHNDHGESREVLALGDRIFTRLSHAPWFQRAIDSDVHELWLDDAQSSVHDLLELAAPAIRLEAATDGPGDLRRFTIRLSDTVDESLRVADEQRAWRNRARIEGAEGHVDLDLATGGWRSADVTLAWTFEGASGRDVRASAHLVANWTPGAVELPAAPEAKPLPARTRYEAERRRLLDGLAGAQPGGLKARP